MEPWIDFGRGPLFRLAFALMLLGLLRAVVLTLTGLEQAYRKNMDRIVPWRDVFLQTAGWMFPVRRFWRRRPLYGSLSFLFHVGLLVVPLFFISHVLLWRSVAGFSWPGIAAGPANWLSLMVIAAGVGLLGGRVFHTGARFISRLQDYVWVILLLVPFATGYACVNLRVSPGAYQDLMLVHVYSADLIMLLIPFTKMAHCVLAPMSQAVTAVAWKFPPGAGDRVAATLGNAERPTWIEKSRLMPVPASGSQDEVGTR